MSLEVIEKYPALRKLASWKTRMAHALMTHGYELQQV